MQYRRTTRSAYEARKSLPQEGKLSWVQRQMDESSMFQAKGVAHNTQKHRKLKE